jgi:hypothetical protein
LNAQEISEVVFSRPSGPLNSNHDLITRVACHAQSCRPCWESIELYQALERRMFTRLSATGVVDFRLPMWLAREGLVDLDSDNNQFLEISLLADPISQATATSVTVAYPFADKDLLLRETNAKRVVDQGYEYVLRRYQVGPITNDVTPLGNCAFVCVTWMDKSASGNCTGLIRLSGHIAVGRAIV